MDEISVTMTVGLLFHFPHDFWVVAFVHDNDNVQCQQNGCKISVTVNFGLLFHVLHHCWVVSVVHDNNNVQCQQERREPA